MEKKHTLELRGERELVLTRPFAAPRRLVWDAYTDCRHLVHWWGPAGWDLTHCELDLRPGGSWHYCMSGQHEGKPMESWGLAIYEEIEAPHRLVYRDAFSDREGTVNADMPQMEITVTFEEIEGGTLLTSSTLFESSEARQQVIDMGVEHGIADTWARLDDYLPTIDASAGTG